MKERDWYKLSPTSEVAPQISWRDITKPIAPTIDSEQLVRLHNEMVLLESHIENLSIIYNNSNIIIFNETSHSLTDFPRGDVADANDVGFSHCYIAPTDVCDGAAV
jgi:hypothetical protein